MATNKRSRGGRLRRHSVRAAVLTLLVAASLLGYGQLSGAAFASAFPAHGTVLDSNDVSIRISLRKLPLRRLDPASLDVRLDGQHVTAEDILIGNGYLVVRRQLDDGPHSVTIGGLGTFRRGSRTWSFVVDGTPPAVRSQALESLPENGSASGTHRFRASFSEPVDATLIVDGAVVPASSGKALSLEAPLTLAAGEHDFVLKGRDAAGHRVRQRWSELVDRGTPTVEVASPGLGGTWRQPPAELLVRVRDDAISGVRVTASVDGEPLGAAKAGTPTGDTRTYAVALPRLPDGKHTIVVEVRDAGDHIVRREGRVTVSRGDVQPPLDVPAVRTALARLRIDRSARTLTLLDAKEEVLHTYRVAVGRLRYPTPLGRFRVVRLEVDPTWDPPDSEWAKGEKRVPPGPNNPLGTRWIGLSARYVGIHGTNTPGSIGTAASHGCIRMKTSDVEELFRVVRLGLPVSIVP